MPQFVRSDWSTNPVDAFILNRLESAGLSPAPLGRPHHSDPTAHLRPHRPAAHARRDRGVPRRRSTRPPTNAWSIACSPRRTTASAGRGTGSTSSATARATASSSTSSATDAWRYRDWVVDALNADMPYDRFVRLQIAGDVLRPADADAVDATGFLVAGAYDTVGQTQQSDGHEGRRSRRRDRRITSAPCRKPSSASPSTAPAATTTSSTRSPRPITTESPRPSRASVPEHAT